MELETNRKGRGRTLTGAATGRAVPGFYRTAAGAEIDLVLGRPGKDLLAIEIKASAAPKISHGFHLACADLQPGRQFVVHSGRDRYPLSSTVEAISLRDLMQILSTE